MSWSNKRWPHSLTCQTPVLDESGNPAFDENGLPSYENITFAVATYNGYAVIRDTDGNPVEEELSELPFGYRTTTESTSKVNKSAYYDRKLSCPLFSTPLPFGAVLVLTDAERSYKATLVKKDSFNWGSNLYINEILQ